MNFCNGRTRYKSDPLFSSVSLLATVVATGTVTELSTIPAVRPRLLDRMSEFIVFKTDKHVWCVPANAGTAFVGKLPDQLVEFVQGKF